MKVARAEEWGADRALADKERGGDDGLAMAYVGPWVVGNRDRNPQESTQGLENVEGLLPRRALNCQ